MFFILDCVYNTLPTQQSSFSIIWPVHAKGMFYLTFMSNRYLLLNKVCFTELSVC